MADVQIQQTPDRGSSNVVWAVVVLVLVALVAWFVFAGGSRGRSNSGANPPAAGAPAGGTGAGAGAGTTPPTTPP